MTGISQRVSAVVLSGPGAGGLGAGGLGAAGDDRSVDGGAWGGAWGGTGTVTVGSGNGAPHAVQKRVPATRELPHFVQNAVS